MSLFPVYVHMPRLCDNTWLLFVLSSDRPAHWPDTWLRELMLSSPNGGTAVWYKHVVFEKQREKYMTGQKYKEWGHQYKQLSFIIWTHQVKSIVEISDIYNHWLLSTYSICQCGEPLPLRQSIPVNNCSVILSRPPWMPKADHLITMCSSASTYSDIQEFKTSEPGTSRKLQHLENKQLIISVELWQVPHIKLGTGLAHHDSSLL